MRTQPAPASRMIGICEGNECGKLTAPVSPTTQPPLRPWLFAAALACGVNVAVLRPARLKLAATMVTRKARANEIRILAPQGVCGCGSPPEPAADLGSPPKPAH